MLGWSRASHALALLLGVGAMRFRAVNTAGRYGGNRSAFPLALHMRYYRKLRYVGQRASVKEAFIILHRGL